MANNFRTLLVVGDEHKKIANKYSLDRGVQPYIKYRFDDMAKLHEEHIQYYKKLLEHLSDKDNDYGRLLVKELKHQEEITDFENYQEITRGCWYDDNGDAWTMENPDAHYKYEKCYDRRIKMDQNDEAPFSNPFILWDGTKAYSAKKCDIDWNKMHMFNTGLYESAWEVCVEGKVPENDTEAQIKNSFSNRKDYFSNFKDKDEYVAHSCAFWTYGVAYEDKYLCGADEDSIKWTTTFFERFIEPLDPNEVLTIYEIKLLD